MKKNLSQDAPTYWLAYLVAFLGCSFSALFAFLLAENLQAYFDILHSIQHDLAWLTLSLGMGFSILMALLIRSMQIAHHRAKSLAQTNADLKIEISERMAAEEVKQKLEVALLQGQKLQSIGTLAGGIAHDFNNTLYAIVGYVEMAREDVDKDSLVYQNLGRVLEATHRGQELIARILAFSRRQQQQLDVISIKDTLEAALALLQPTIPASVMLHFTCNQDMTIQANRTQIHQIIVNMINNAVDAMDGDGIINIQISEIGPDDIFLKQFPETLSQKYCKIEITDTGHGMDQAMMERIFEPFYTTKEVGKGTGLGLSIVHTIVKENHGEITVASQLGQGTTFTILLPEHIAEARS